MGRSDRTWFAGLWEDEVDVPFSAIEAYEGRFDGACMYSNRICMCAVHSRRSTSTTSVGFMSTTSIVHIQHIFVDIRNDRNG